MASASMKVPWNFPGCVPSLWAKRVPIIDPTSKKNRTETPNLMDLTTSNTLDPFQLRKSPRRRKQPRILTSPTVVGFTRSRRVQKPAHSAHIMKPSI